MSQPPHQKPLMDEAVGKRINTLHTKTIKMQMTFFPRGKKSDNGNGMPPKLSFIVLFYIYSHNKSPTLIGTPVF